MKKIMIVFGTRPEAIKMAPVVAALKSHLNFAVEVCVTAQHREMLDQVLSLFQIVPDYDLNLMSAGQTLPAIFSKVLLGMTEVVERAKPDLVLVHGDTTTTAATAMACFYQRVSVGHVEAGLRTGNALSPYPEENHRKMIAVLSSLHFAPSGAARDALLAEGIAADAIAMTGNTVIDALQWILQNVPDPYKEGALPSGDKRPDLVVTEHRRENFDGLHEQYFKELNALAAKMPGMQVIFVMHPNPNVRVVAEEILTQENIFMTPPMAYADFLHLLRGAKLIITDSGGIQEESAFFGKPTLVIREQTERKELLMGGNMIVMGTEEGKLSAQAHRLLSDEAYYQQHSQANFSYGRGDASAQIVERVVQWKNSTGS